MILQKLQKRLDKVGQKGIRLDIDRDAAEIMDTPNDNTSKVIMDMEKALNPFLYMELDKKEKQDEVNETVAHLRETVEERRLINYEKYCKSWDRYE